MKKIIVLCVLSSLLLSLSASAPLLASSLQSITVGSERLQAKRVMHNGVEIVQPIVAQQYGASCGYNAVFNGQALFHDLNGVGNSPFKLANQAECARLFGDLSKPWRQFAQRVEGDDAQDDLSFIEADTIARLALQHTLSIDQNFSVLDADHNFLGHKDAAYNGSASTKKQFWDALRTRLKNETPFNYAFFVNTHSAAGGERQQNAHWVLLYVYKGADQVHRYYVADSLNLDRTGQPYITKIIDELEKSVLVVALQPVRAASIVPVQVASAASAASLAQVVDTFDADIQRVLALSKQEAEQAERLFEAQLEQAQKASKKEAQKALERQKATLKELERQRVFARMQQDKAAKERRDEEQRLLDQVKQESLQGYVPVMMSEEEQLAQAIKESAVQAIADQKRAQEEAILASLFSAFSGPMLSTSSSRLGAPMSQIEQQQAQQETEQERRRRLAADAAQQRADKNK